MAKELRYLSTVRVTAAVCSIFHQMQLHPQSGYEYLAGVSPHLSPYGLTRRLVFLVNSRTPLFIASPCTLNKKCEFITDLNQQESTELLLHNSAYRVRTPSPISSHLYNNKHREPSLSRTYGVILQSSLDNLRLKP